MLNKEEKEIADKAISKITKELQENPPVYEDIKPTLPLRQINQLAYIYMAVADVRNKIIALQDHFNKDNLKRIRTADTHWDKALGDVMLNMNRDTFRQLEYYIRTHEVCMIPRQDKMKYLKNLKKQEHLMTARSVICKSSCIGCKRKTSEGCPTKKLLEDCGTPYFYDMGNMDKLPEDERRAAKFCGFSGGVGQ